MSVAVLQAQRPQHFEVLQVEVISDFLIISKTFESKICLHCATYIDYVARTRPFDLQPRSALVLWSPMPHPLYH